MARTSPSMLLLSITRRAP